MTRVRPGHGLWTLPRGRLVLASASPRRRMLLEQQGLRFEVRPAHVDEELDGADPRTEARRLALAKARAVAEIRPRAWVIGADTVVARRGALLGKPGSRAEGLRMLRTLAGRRHQVVTAVALCGPGFERCRTVTTRVEFQALSDAEIRAYLASGEADDKAGSYALQGLGAVLVRRIEGDWTNVIGLPLAALRRLLAEAAGR